MQLALHPSARQKLARVGVHTVEDLLQYLPHRYDDFSRVVAVRNLQPGDTVAVEGVLEGVKIVRTWKRHMQLIEAQLVGQSGRVRAVWFNQTYLIRTLKNGTRVALTGKVYENRNGIYFANPAYELTTNDLYDQRPLRPTTYDTQRTPSSVVRPPVPSPSRDESSVSDSTALHTRRLVPVYREVAGVSSRWLQGIIGQHLHAAGGIIDILPEDLRTREKFPPLEEAIYTIHFPKSQQEADAARARFQFEELFLLQLRFLSQRSRLQQTRAHAIAFNQAPGKRFVDALPFPRADGQRKAAWHCLQDIPKPRPMQRLLGGAVDGHHQIVSQAPD